MEDDASIFLDGKTLANLRVVDLKLELEKRGLSKSGSKKDLVKRLKQQLEFEKLCGERKSTGDCDLKLELDADTEQNEFVQQYLAQQQKIYAQQKEVKRRVELEEIQKSGDEKESCDSTKGDDDKTEDESETEPKDDKGDKVHNDSDISLKQHTKVKSDDVFEPTGASHPTPVNQDAHSTEKKNRTAEDCKVLVPDDPQNETLKSKAEVRDIEKDREKELSTAISSLLSVEKSDKQVDKREDLAVTEDSVTVDGAVTRMTHDDDREKDLATAVLSSLLVGEDVEKEAKSEEVVTDSKEVDGTPVQLESDIVTESIETETSSEIGETCDKGLPDSVKVSAESTIDTKDGGQLEVACVELKSNVASECSKSETSGNDKTCDKDLPDSVEVSTIDTKDDQLEVDGTCARLESNVVVECSRAETTSGIGKTYEKHLHDSMEVNVESIIDTKDEGQSEPLEVAHKPLSEVVPDSVNAESTIKVKDKGDSEASLEVVQKHPVESSEITQAVQEEISSNMDVSSVPYSLSEIQLPESPVNIVKPQVKTQSGNESAKTTESDEDVQSSSVNSKSNNIVKSSESGDLNGKDTKSNKEGKNSEDPAQITLEKEPESEKVHRVKGSEVGNTKRSKVDRSDSDISSGDEKSRSSRKDKGHKKKYDGSDDNRSPLKKSADSSRSKVDRRKGRRNRSSSSESGRSRDRSRSPKSSKSSRRDRNHHRRSRSSEKDPRSKTKSKRGSPKKSSRDGRRKRDRRHRSGSSEDDQSLTKDRSPKKVSKVGRRERSVSSEKERLSRTRSRESPKKDVKIGLEEKSISSDDERPSRTQNKGSPIKESKVSCREKSGSSGDEQPFRTQSKESPEKDAKVSRREKSVSSEEEGPLNLGNKDGHKSEAVASRKEQSQSSKKEQRSLSQSQEELKRESQTSHKEKSPIKETIGLEDEQKSGTSSLESSPKKTPEKMAVKDSKRKYSVSSDDESRREQSPVKKPIPTGDVSQFEDTQEKMDCQSPVDKPARSGHSSSPRPTRSLRPDERRTSSSRSRSPEKFSINREFVSRSGKRPPSPKEVRMPSSSESSPEKDDLKTSPKRVSKPVPKAEVSEGELTSSRESSPHGMEAVSKWEGVAVHKPSMDSSFSKQSTITVIKKEAPKQRLKIKRDNVIVIKKDKERESLPDEGQSTIECYAVQTPEPIEMKKMESGECPDVPPSTTYVSRKITLSNRKQTEKLSEEPATKRSKWGSFAASRKAKQTVSISTDSLKNWFPDFKLLKEPVAELTPEAPPSPSKDATEVEMTPVERRGVDVEEPKISTVTKRLEQPPMEEESKVATLDTPLKDSAEPTCILFVRNLVRPFTLLQLKEMLKETGKMVDEQFWIDKIKSKCFVTYETEEEAAKTRSVLNGTRWPTSNPKILAVDFATEDDLSFHRSGAVDRPKPLPASSPPRPAPHQSKERERRTPERDGRRERLPVREWDKDKMRQESPEKMERRREEDRIKGTDKDKKEGTKRRPNEDTPAKLLDDLFQKTKAIPCIYWLPLNQEQVKERAEQLKQVRLDRERRNQEREQENKRPRSKQRVRETDTRRSSSRSRSPATRRR